MPVEAVLTCWGNSHPFQERKISLEEPIKIGRSVAQSRPSSNNAIFDCKVLSRNHALMWLENGKFFLQDTKSSNGTFVNNQRLSKGSEESSPREISSSDVLQFGVDVVENSRKVTHSCIVATVKFYDSEGKEIIKNNTSAENVYPASSSIQSQEFYQLLQFLQEALHREQLLENKLAVLKQLAQSTQEVADNGWQNLINEERLLSKLEVLESQLCACSKLQPEEYLKQEILALQDDKFQYECVAKDSLRKVLEEKLEAIKKISDLERLFSSKEEECLNLQEQCLSAQNELESLAGKYQAQLQELQESKIKLQEVEKKKEFETVEFCKEKDVLLKTIEDLSENLKSFQAKVESLQADKDFSLEQLNNIKEKVESMKKFDVDNNFDKGIEKAVQADLVNFLDLHLLQCTEPFEEICDEVKENKRAKVVQSDFIDEIQGEEEMKIDYEAQIDKHVNMLEKSQELIEQLQDHLILDIKNQSPEEVVHTKEMAKISGDSDMRKLKEFISLKDECLHLSQKIVDIENEVQLSQKENGLLRLECSRLQESNNLLEQTKNSDVWNATDSQKELVQKTNEIERLKAACSAYDEQFARLRRELDIALHDYTLLSQNTQTISLLSVIPLGVLVISLVIAFYPFFSRLTATTSHFLS